MSDLERQAKDDIHAIFGDTTASPEITLDILKRLIDELIILIDGLESNIRNREKEVRDGQR